MSLQGHPRISVVVPSLNQGHYIESALLSILGQRYPDVEILVIDGGSTDETLSVLERYADEIQIWCGEDSGQADAINRGLEHVTGDILCWLNTDDFYLPGAFNDVAALLGNASAEPALVYGAAVAFREEEGALKAGMIPPHAFDRSRLTYHDYIVQPSTFWTRALWERTGPLRTKYQYVLDWDWYLRASETAQFSFVPRFYSCYRYHPLHKTSGGGGQRRAEILDVVSTYSSRYWIDLYELVGAAYPGIAARASKLAGSRIPRFHLVLAATYPDILRRLRRPSDLLVVLEMYGWSPF